MVTMLAALIYGTFFYRRTLTFSRVLAVTLCVDLICNVFLNTWCLSILYGKGISVLIGPRFVKNIVMWPVDSFLFYIIAKKLEDVGLVRAIRRFGSPGKA